MSLDSIKKVIVYSVIRKEEDKKYSNLLIDRLEHHGCEYEFDIGNGTAYSYDDADIIIVLGGDGSIMRAAAKAISHDVPIVGVNFGRLGYMAELEKYELKLIDKLFEGNFSVEKRMTLKAEKNSNGGNCVICDGILNDIVISRGGYSKSVDMSLYANASNVRAVRADGMVFATPTGSTAYSMAAGGSVLDPGLECICVTPICPISRYACPIVFSGDTVLELENSDSRAFGLNITCDGMDGAPLEYGARIVISRSNKYVKMVKLKSEGFFEVLNQKLSRFEF